MMEIGKVYLVGAGPGDSELLTLKGLDCIRKANLILYDALINFRLLDKALEGVKKIDVGKRSHQCYAGLEQQQTEINNLMIRNARAGLVVVRLKGGDPFVFGRGGEEAEALQKAGVPFEIVPGVTSGIAAPAYAGIPLTHRKISSLVTFVTGHRASLIGKHEVDWEGLGRLDGTLVIFMGVTNRKKVSERLINGGRSPETPVAVVQLGTFPEQKTVRTTLKGLGGTDIVTPATIIVGEIAALDLHWLDSKPLFGRRIVVTRTREQASDLVEKLLDLGADTLEAPTIQIVDPIDWGPVDRAIEEIEVIDWILFSSPNGVTHFFKRIWTQGKDLRALKHTKIAAVGPATAERLASYTLKVDLCPSRHVAEGIVESFEREGSLQGKNFLIVRPEISRNVLINGIQKMGGKVREIVTYRTTKPSGLSQHVLEALDSGKVDLATFTSSSTVRNFAELLGKERLKKVADKVLAACIGPITAKTAQNLGFQVIAEPSQDKNSISRMVEGIKDYFKNQN